MKKIKELQFSAQSFLENVQLTEKTVPWLPAVFFFVPLLYCLLSGYSLLGVGEESFGYRYFYSHRILNDASAAPWLPQGILVGLIFHTFNLTADLFNGFDISSITRMHVASYLITAFSVSILSALSWLVVSYFSGLNNKLLASFIIIGSVFSSYAGGGIQLLLPDYYIYEGIYCLIIFIVWGEIHSGRLKGDSLALCIAFAAVVVLATLIKVTLLPMAMLVLVYALLSSPSRPLKTFSILLLGGVLGVALSVLFQTLYYAGDFNAVMDGLSIARLRSAVAIGHDPLSNVFMSVVFGSVLDVFPLFCIVPAVLIAVVIVGEGRVFSAFCALISIISFSTLLFRYYPPSVIGFLAVQSVLLLITIKRFEDKIVMAPRMGRASVTAVIVFLVFLGVYRTADTLPKAYAQASVTEQKLASLMATNDGNTVFLIPTNDLRPATVDMALAKGGADIGHYYWTPSRSLSSAFKDRSYFTFSQPIDVNPNEAGLIIFAHYKGDDEKQKNILERRFGVDFRLFSCSILSNMGLSPLNFYIVPLRANAPFPQHLSPPDGKTPRMLSSCSRREVITAYDPDEVLSEDVRFLWDGRRVLLERSGDENLYFVDGKPGQVQAIAVPGGNLEDQLLVRRTAAGDWEPLVLEGYGNAEGETTSGLSEFMPRAEATPMQLMTSNNLAYETSMYDSVPNYLTVEPLKEGEIEGFLIPLRESYERFVLSFELRQPAGQYARLDLRFVEAPKQAEDAGENQPQSYLARAYGILGDGQWESYKLPFIMADVTLEKSIQLSIIGPKVGDRLDIRNWSIAPIAQPDYPANCEW